MEKLKANGGGDIPESSLDAIMLALNQPFTPEVIRNEDEDSKVYRQLIGVSKGLCFELGKGEDFKSRSEHFKKVLMQLGKTIAALTE